MKKIESKRTNKRTSKREASERAPPKAAGAASADSLLLGINLHARSRGRPLGQAARRTEHCGGSGRRISFRSGSVLYKPTRTLCSCVTVTEI